MIGAVGGVRNEVFDSVEGGIKQGQQILRQEAPNISSKVASYHEEPTHFSFSPSQPYQLLDHTVPINPEACFVQQCGHWLIRHPPSKAVEALVAMFTI